MKDLPALNNDCVGSEEVVIIPEIQLCDRLIGSSHPVFIVAECGINHNGELDLALRLIEAAAASGAEGVKFQLFRAAGMYTPRAGDYRTATGDFVPIYKLMQDVELPLSWLPELSRASRDHGLKFIMTVCDEWCVQVMDDIEFDVYKVASYEIAHLPMLAEIARRDKPVFISTGAATEDEVREGMALLSANGTKPVGLFQCTAKYPAPEQALDLAVIPTLAAQYPNVVPGFSDHSFDPTRAPVQAVLHGARVIEKHFTLDRNLPGADHSFAVEPQHLRALVQAVRETEARLAAGEELPLDPVLAGRNHKVVEPPEQVLRNFATRGIFSLRDIAAGEAFSRENLRVLRPGELRQGLHPRYYEQFINGACARRDIPQWTGLQWEDVEEGAIALDAARN